MRFSPAALLFIFSGTALAQTGVSDDRVVLPDGPGSMGGMGDNASVDPNMGSMGFSVPFETPAGFAGVSPSLSLTYSSMGGGGVVGMGWSFGTPVIERMTQRGLPTYTLADDFVAGGGVELVLIPGSNPPTYRARFEGSFVRYTWMDAGTGAQGWWKAEMPDGRVNYYGADAQGTLAPPARSGGAQGTFRYHLVESVDVFGHKLVHRYAPQQGNITLIDSMAWGHDANGTARYEVSFSYEPRPDAISDCKGGYNELLEHRLAGVSVTVGGQLLRRYALTYETISESGGASRLKRVEHFAGDGTRHPLVYSFGYSQALGGVCNGMMCEMPYLVEMGSLGVSLGAGTATLLDINGDALPDVVETPSSGPHRFFLSRLQPDGTHTFAAPVTSAMPSNSSLLLTTPGTQVMDVDGDGLTDMVSAKTGDVYYNLGTGDWAMTGRNTVGAIPDFDGDAVDAQRSIQFLDYDGDRRIDIIQSTNTDTFIYRNTGAGGFVQDMSVDVIGAGFQEDGLQLADMNGDNLLDAVTVGVNLVRYRLNLGRGQFDDWVELTGITVSDQDIESTDLQDINGDGMADLVTVTGNQVRFSINRNGRSFLPTQTIASAAGGSIPERLSTTTVLYADMNGNGSDDIVWIDQSGKVTYVELFPVRPNLLARIDDGMGQTTEVTYSSTVLHQARDAADGAPWANKVPHAVLVVDSMDEYDSLHGIHEDVGFLYHDAFYDGVDKQFRGFARVDMSSTADATQEQGLTTVEFDVGITDRYRAGLRIRSQTRSGGRDISEDLSTFEDCPLTGIPTTGLRFPIRHICQTRAVTVLKEGRPQAEWVTTEKRMTYDGYGNKTLEADLGVTSVGGGACAPCDASAGALNSGACGAMCLGDEAYTETDYVLPTSTGGRWILGKPWRVRTYAVPMSNLVAETITRYDGLAFEGLPEGQLTLGVATHTTAKKSVDSTEIVEMSRVRVDAHGQVLESLDPNGDPSGTDHRATYTYDGLGLRVTRAELQLLDGTGAPYQLRRDYLYDPLHDVPVEATSWMLVRNGQAQSARNAMYVLYDVFGRVTGLIRPGGDTTASPTEEYVYELGSNHTRVVLKKRTRLGQPYDHEEVSCMDGRGRVFQKRTQLAANRYQVTGFTVFNRDGHEVREYQPYESPSGACDTMPPADVAFTDSFFDATGRALVETEPDASIYGSRSETRFTYLPLTTVVVEDTAQGATGGSINTTRTDGLGRTIALERRGTAANATAAVHRLWYNGLGYLQKHVGPTGIARTQEHDLLGRVTRVVDPDRGTLSFTYDGVGNTLTETDGRGIVTRNSYDSFNRILAEWQDGDEENTRITHEYDASSACPAAKCTSTPGQLVRTIYPGGEVRFGYNTRGDITYFAREVQGQLLEFGHTFDNLSRPVSTTYPHGRRVDYTTDPAGRITAVPGFIDEVRYNARGVIELVRYANGVQTTQTFDERLRLATMQSQGTGGARILDYTFERDRTGNVTRVVDARPDLAGPSGNARFTYDAYDRLVRADLDMGRTSAESLTLTYDDGDNILSNTSSLGAASRAHVGSYTYGEQGAGPHAVTTAGNLSMRYDASGYMTRRGSQQYAWDHQGRLTSVSDGTRTTATFQYGSTAERTVKRSEKNLSLYVMPDYEVRDGVAMVYIRLGHLAVARAETTELQADLYDDVAPASVSGSTASPLGDGVISAADAWIAEAASSGVFTTPPMQREHATRLLLSASARRMLTDENGALYFHHDHLGNTVATTDGAGTVVARTEYYPFGAVRLESGGLGEERRYTGKETDDETGLVSFNARYLDPVTGRWVSPDPTFVQLKPEMFERPDEATNGYTFVGNNPATGRDPDGRLFMIGPIGAVVGFVVGAGLEVMCQMAQGIKFKDINRAKIVAAAVAGAVSGAIAGEAGILANVVGRTIEAGSYLVTKAIATKAGASPSTAARIATGVSKVIEIGVGFVSGTIVNNVVAGAATFAFQAASMIKSGIVAGIKGAVGIATIALKPKIDALGKAIQKFESNLVKRLDASSKRPAKVRTGNIATRAAKAVFFGIGRLVLAAGATAGAIVATSVGSTSLGGALLRKAASLLTPKTGPKPSSSGGAAPAAAK